MTLPAGCPEHKARVWSVSIFAKPLLVSLLLLLFFHGRVTYGQGAAIGRGCTTATMIDWDCDGYGPGSPRGPDADDNDPTVNTPQSWRAKHGFGPTDTSVATLKKFLAHLGYANVMHIIFVDPARGNDSSCTLDNIAKPCATP